MALTRSELELLITAKNSAKGELDQLNAQLRGTQQAAGLATSGTTSLNTGVRTTAVGTGALNSALGFFTGTVALQAVDALAGVVMGMADFAGELADAREKTGATAEGLQRINASAKQSGIEFGQVTSALTQMNNRLAEGGKSTVGALGQLNLSLDDLRRMRPDQAMEAIAVATGKIPDPMVRTQIAMDLFGKSGAQLLPILNNQMKELGDNAERNGAIMSEDTVTAWDEFSDTIGETLEIGKGLIGAFLGPLLTIINPLLQGVQYLARGFKVLFDLYYDWITGPISKQVIDFFEAIGVKATKLPTITGPATEALKKQQDELADRGLKVKDVTEEETKAYEKQAEGMKKSAKEAERLATVKRGLFGQDDIAKANDYVKVIGNITNLSKLGADEQVRVNQAVTDAIGVYQRMGQTAPKAMLDLQAATNLAALASDNLKIKSESVADAVKGIGRTTIESAPAIYAVPLQTADLWDGAIRRTETGIKRIPGFWAGVLPDISQTVGTIQAAVEGSFAQMLLGAKGWKDGMVDIWRSLKAGVLNILNDILSAFLNGFLKGMLGAMSGQRGAFSAAFGGLFGGGGGGGLFGGGGGGGTSGGGGGWLAGLFGGGGGAGGGGTAGAGGAGGAGVGAFAQYAGGGLLAAGGLVQLLQAQGLGQNILGGATTGAGIGTMIAPGIGTAIGAGAGALVGLIKAVFGGGPSKEELASRDVVKQFEAILASGLSTTQQLEAGGESWRQTVVAVRDAYLRLGLSEQQALSDVNALWASSRDGGTQTQTIIERIAQTMDQAAAAAAKAEQTGAAAGDQTAAAMDTAADRVSELEQKVTDAKVRLESLGLSASDAGDSASDAMEDARIQVQVFVKELETARAEAAKLGSKAEDVGEEFVTFGDAAAEAGKDARDWLDRARNGIGDLLRDLQNFDPPPLEIPYSYVATNSAPEADQYELPAAAGGFYASGQRPAITVFGEGGQPEVGGPRSFFKAIFEELGLVGGQGLGGGKGITLVNNFNVFGTLDQTTVDQDVIPRIVEAVSGNLNQVRTDLRAGLGVS